MSNIDITEAKAFCKLWSHNMAQTMLASALRPAPSFTPYLIELEYLTPLFNFLCPKVDQTQFTLSSIPICTSYEIVSELEDKLFAAALPYLLSDKPFSFQVREEMFNRVLEGFPKLSHDKPAQQSKSVLDV